MSVDTLDECVVEIEGKDNLGEKSERGNLAPVLSEGTSKILTGDYFVDYLESHVGFGD